jgi:hypothetical protein
MMKFNIIEVIGLKGKINMKDQDHLKEKDIMILGITLIRMKKRGNIIDIKNMIKERMIIKKNRVENIVRNVVEVGIEKMIKKIKKIIKIIRIRDIVIMMIENNKKNIKDQVALQNLIQDLKVQYQEKNKKIKNLIKIEDDILNIK